MIGYTGLPKGTFSRIRCNHLRPLVSSDGQQDGTRIETCSRCGAKWVIAPSGARERAWWGR